MKECFRCGGPAAESLSACPWCVPVRRESDIDEINQRYAPGGDHDELLTELRQEYYDYLEND